MKKLILSISAALMAMMAMAQTLSLLNLVQDYSGKWGYCTQSGRIVIKPKYDNAFPFRDGFAAVERNGKWGYINEQGRTVVRCIYDCALDFNKGYAMVKKNGKWGAVNTKGELEIPCDYDLPSDLLDLKVVRLTPEQIETLDKLVKQRHPNAAGINKQSSGQN